VTRLSVLKTRWEDVIRVLATKADLERSHGELRAEIHKMDASVTKWMLTSIIALIVGFGRMFFALQRNIDNAITRIERLHATQTAPTTSPAPGN